MLSRRCAAVIGGALLAWLMPTPAVACLFNPTVFIGSDAGRARWERQQVRDARRALVARRRAFRAGVRSGRVDSAEGLARLLVPNVREWYADTSDCGPGGDGHGPTMSATAMMEQAFVGSELEGWDGGSLMRFFAPFFRSSLRSFNRSCNEEVRGDFATRLRRVQKRELERALLLLSADGERTAGYYRFPDATRRERPTLETWRSRPVGFLSSANPVTHALDLFWIDTLPRLRSQALTCPAAHRTLVSEREAVLQEARGLAFYPRARRAAAERRALYGT